MSIGVAFAVALIAGTGLFAAPVVSAAPAHGTRLPAVQGSASPYGLRYENSTSWAGIVVDARANTVTNVGVRWNLPYYSGNCNGSNSGAEVSFWVGMGGWNSTAIARVGTTIVCNHSSFTYLGWYQFYPSAPVPIPILNSGGGAYGDVQYLTSNHTYLMQLDGFRTWVTHPGINRSSADYIVEAGHNSTRTLPLLDFRFFEFRKARPTIGDRVWPALSYTGVRHPLSVFILTMTNTNGTAPIATFSDVLRPGYQVVWQGYGP
jgi:hypothetical protein